MTITSYETKEQTADGFRAVVVMPFEQGGGRVELENTGENRHSQHNARLFGKYPLSGHFEAATPTCKSLSLLNEAQGESTC